jgi:hypothetical protein
MGLLLCPGDRLAHLETEKLSEVNQMSDQETMAAFRALIESRIPATQAEIVKVENDPNFSEEYKAWQIGHLRGAIATAEAELVGFDNLILSIRRS